MANIRVLIVDDSSAARHGLRSILRALPDMEVVGEASNGRDAIVTTGKLRPDVILMDAQMPEMDGVEATRRIKDLLPQVKVLFLAVHTEHIEVALAAGADAYLMKDSGRQELSRKIRELAGEDPKFVSCEFPPFTDDHTAGPTA